MDLSKESKQFLLEKCGVLGLKKYKSKSKNELIELILSHESPDESPIETPKESPSIMILHNDCLLELEKMADNTIDCVITDPPYFIDKLDNHWSSAEINSDVKNSHIKHLPKGMKFEKSQVKDLFDYYLKLSQLLFKKMKPGGYFLSFSSPRLYHAQFSLVVQ